MAEQNATAVAITGGTATLSSVTTPSVTATTNDLTLNAISTGNINLNTAGGTSLKASKTFLTGTAVNYFDASGRQTGLGPIFSVNGSDADVRMNITAKGTGSIGFYTNLANTLQMQITPTASAVNYVQVTGAATAGRPTISSQGSDTNIDIALTPKGTGGIVGNVNSGTFTINRDSANNAIKFTAPNGNLYLQTTGGGVILFNTGDGTPNQMRVSHTASAVNYVQVTGSATGTGNSPTISAQGSDTDVNLTLAPKAAGLFRVTSGVGGSSRFSIDNGGVTNLGISGSGGSGFRVSPTTSQVNSLSTTGTVSGSNNVVLSTQGTDTNIDLALTPKGTGLVRFGTYVAGALLATGYINIKAADGTTYKVLVST
jgi:hypothetical protein